MKQYSILFLCTGNSARSILAEAYLNFSCKGRFRAYSAGSHPAGAVNPYALELLARHGIEVAGLRSKSWDEFARPGAPSIDMLITVCDDAAGEVCPVWPGRPLTAHWGMPDPAAVSGSDEVRRTAFERTLAGIAARIDRLLALPVETLNAAALKAALQEIGAASHRFVHSDRS